jgi:hypothetical protein
MHGAALEGMACEWHLIPDTTLTIVSVLLSVYSIRQRTRREKAVIAAHATIERAYGLLIGIKPSLAGGDVTAALNDGLEAINQQRQTLDAL